MVLQEALEGHPNEEVEHRPTWLSPPPPVWPVFKLGKDGVLRGALSKGRTDDVIKTYNKQRSHGKISSKESDGFNNNKKRSDSVSYNKERSYRGAYNKERSDGVTYN